MEQAIKINAIETEIYSIVQNIQKCTNENTIESFKVCLF